MTEDLKRLPKVLLHDHLDGGLRPETVAELAEASGYDALPTSDPVELAAWFHQGEASSLESYLEAFRHTVGVMQSPDALHRVAREASEDLAGDGVIYAESRFAPSLHTRGGLDRSQVIGAVLEGFAAGAAAGGAEMRVIVDAMRQDTDSMDVAVVAAEFADSGVVGFDLAGPEAGHPATDHAAACDRARRGGLHLTIHAGEGHPGGSADLKSIMDALECAPERIGHGVRLIDDLSSFNGEVHLGATATHIKDRGVVLEQCPTSNLQIKAVSSPEEHPLGAFYRAGIPVTINTDNRLMSGVSLSDEFGFALKHQGFTRADLEAVTMTAVDAAFCDAGTKQRLRERIREGFAA